MSNLAGCSTCHLISWLPTSKNLMQAKFLHYPLPNHSLYRIIWPEEVDAVCYVRKEGHYKNCIVFVTGPMLHHLSLEEETNQSLFAKAENLLGISIDSTALLAKKDPECEILYSKDRPANFWLSEHHLSPGQDVSIRYGVRRERIDWRATYSKLKQKREFKLKHNRQQRPFLELERCNILGIELEKLSIFESKLSPNYPINSFQAELFGNRTSQTYFDLKNWLLKRGGLLLEANERETHLNCRIDLQDIEIRLVYPTRTFESYQRPGVVFTLSNRRSYPDLLELRPAEKDIQLDECIELPEIKLTNKYRENEMVRFLPVSIQARFPDKCILWIDRRLKLVGLSDRSFANILNINKITGFFLQNVAPARGPGWSQLGVVHKRYGDISLIGSAFRKLDYLQSFVEEKLQLPFDTRKEWYDA